MPNLWAMKVDWKLKVWPHSVHWWGLSLVCTWAFQCDIVDSNFFAHQHVLLQTALLWKLLSTGFTLKASAVLLLNVLIQLLLLLEPTLAVVALEELHFVLFVFVHMEKHWLSSRGGLPAPKIWFFVQSSSLSKYFNLTLGTGILIYRVSVWDACNFHKSWMVEQVICINSKKKHMIKDWTDQRCTCTMSWQMQSWWSNVNTAMACGRCGPCAFGYFFAIFYGPVRVVFLLAWPYFISHSY